MEWQIGAQRSIEGRNLSVTCVTPLILWTYSTIFSWTKTDLLFRYDGHMLWIPNIEREESGTYACHSEITCGPRFLKLIQTKCSTATIYDLYFVINFPVLLSIINMYVVHQTDRQCRLSSLYRKRNVRRKTFKESSYSDSNFTDTKNRNGTFL